MVSAGEDSPPSPGENVPPPLSQSAAVRRDPAALAPPAVFGDPNGPVLTIEYCSPCNYLPRALWHAQELLTCLATTVSALRLVPADKGRYTVTLGARELFSKQKEGRFPEASELLKLALATLDASVAAFSSPGEDAIREQDGPVPVPARSVS